MPSHLGILARQMLDRHRRGRRGAQRGQQVAADHRLGLAGVGIEQEDGRLVVDDAALFKVVRPISARLQARVSDPALVETALEAVKRILVPDGLADDREVVGVARRHGGETPFRRRRNAASRVIRSAMSLSGTMNMYCLLTLKFVLPVCHCRKVTHTQRGDFGPLGLIPLPGTRFQFA